MSFKKNPDKTDAGKSSGCMAWSCVAGSVAGAVLGIFIGHWVVWAIFLGVFGLMTGALIDRSRR